MSELINEAWDFVEEYYPDYYMCDTISLCGDLLKILDKDYTEDDSCYTLLNNEYEGNDKNPNIRADCNELMVQIYQKAITAFYQKTAA